jgi:hypothetical protein
MPWKSLGNSLGSKPRVLAGPLLRKVTRTSVTVWLAMRVGATVILTVQDERNRHVMRSEPRRSVAIGENLHIVAVTATPLTSAENLAEGIVYCYDLHFVFDDDNVSPTSRLPPTMQRLLIHRGRCRVLHCRRRI